MDIKVFIYYCYKLFKIVLSNLLISLCYNFTTYQSTITCHFLHESSSNNLGPKIKLRLNLLGDIMSNIETEVKPYGINNAYVELRIHLEVTARVVLPFVSEKIVISNVIPLSMNIVQGVVPEAYISSYK